ncbi:MAG: ATP-binding protein [Pseudomonadales bacterium]
MSQFLESGTQTFQFSLDGMDRLDLPQGLVARLQHHGRWCQETGAKHEMLYIYNDSKLGLRSRRICLEPNGEQVVACCHQSAAHPPHSDIMLLVDQVADRIPEGVMVITFTGESGEDSLVTFVNQAMVNLLGSSRAEILGSSEAHWVIGFVDAAEAPAWRQAIEDFSDLQLEVELRRHNGEKFTAAIQRNVVRDATGWISQAVITCRDVSSADIKQRYLQHQELEFYLNCLDEHALLLKLDKRFMVTFANQKLCETLKVRRSALYRKSLAWLETTPERREVESPQQGRPYLLALQATESWRGDLITYTQDGAEVHLDTTMSTWPGAVNSEGEIYVVAYDITRRKQVESVARAISGLNGRNLAVPDLAQQATRQLVEISRSQAGSLIADGLQTAWPTAESVADCIHSATSSLQFRVQFQTESPGSLTLYGRPGGYESGLRQILQPLVDMVVLAEKERRTAASDRELQFENRFILETLKIGSWRRDFAAKSWTFSDSLYELLEYPPGETVPQELWDQRVPEAEQKKLRESLQEMIDTNETREVLVITEFPDGRKKYIQIQGRAIRDAAGSTQEVLGIASDVSQEIITRRELENQKALASHQARLASIGELASGVGHEVNNPLTIIRGFLDIVQQQLNSGRSDPRELSELMGKMDDSARRIEKIVKGLRSLSHVDAAVKESFSAEPILRDTIGFVDEIYRRQGVSVEMVSNVPSSARLSGHEGKLQQILMNLLSNARDATEEQLTRRIRAEFSVVDQALVLRIQDNGPGVPEDIVERIFDPFFTTKDIGKGTGIGLSMVFSIVQEFAGTVACVTSPLGGAEFRVVLPLLKDGARHKRHVAEESPPADESFVGRVLVVDDEEGVREFLQIMLTKLGLSVDVAGNGREALTAIEQADSPFDLVITDLTMPVLGGLELVEALQQLDQTVPEVVLATGRPDFTFDQAKYPIVVGLLNKPFNLNTLRRLLDGLKVRRA